MVAGSCKILINRRILDTCKARAQDHAGDASGVKPVLNAFRRHVKNPHIGLSLVHQSLECGFWLAREAARAGIDRKFNLVAAQMLGQKLQRLKVLVEEAGATVVLQQPDA